MKPAIKILATMILVAATVFTTGCSKQSEPLVVYSGKGLKYAVDEIIRKFEQVDGGRVSVVYAGSKTLLNTIRKTGRGDIYIPGSESYLKQAGELVTRSAYIARHVPVFVASAAQAGRIQSFQDLLNPEVSVAIGNSKMAAIGKVAQAVIERQKARGQGEFNIVVSASTVNELLDLVIKNEVDAALVWKDMLSWESAAGLIEIPIPDEINQAKRISVGMLATTSQEARAARFFEFVATDGSQIFTDRGFPR